MEPSLPEVLAVVLAGASGALLLPGAPPIPGAPPRSRGELPGVAAPLATVSVGLALWAWLSTERFVLAVLLAGTALGVGRVLARRRAAGAAERRSEQVLGVCDTLASDLAAGQPPLHSLERAATEWPELAPVAVAARLGADIPAALRELSTRPGARQLRTLAATWQVAHDTGSGLAAAIGQAAVAIREDRRTARLVGAELASAHATSRMLAVLPLGVLLLGSGIGGDPIGFLTGSVPGLVCLALGLALSFAGLLWLERIADRVLGR
jgi:tight adherence protein B